MRGGKRAGAGRKPGKTGPQRRTIEKEQLRCEARELIAPHMPDMLAAQVENAKGIKYLVVRSKRTGKFVRVSEGMAKAKQGDDEEQIEVWEKDPSVFAFAELMNRLLDKPMQPQMLKASITHSLESLVSGSQDEET